MQKISIINNNELIEFLIQDSKFIIGSDYEKKDTIIKVFINYFNKVLDSDYALENEFVSKVKIDDDRLNIADYDFFYISGNYDLLQDLKLGTKTIAFQYLNVLFENVEYDDSFQTISILLQSILDDFDDEELLVPFFEINFTKKEFIKLITMSFLKNDSIINNYDLSLEDRILLQLKMVKMILKNSNKKSVIIVDAPILTDTISLKLNDIVGLKLIFFEKTTRNDIDDVLILGDVFVDTSDENKLFDLCNDYYRYITIKEMKKELIKNHLTPRIIMSR